MFLVSLKAQKLNMLYHAATFENLGNYLNFSPNTGYNHSNFKIQLTMRSLNTWLAIQLFPSFFPNIISTRPFTVLF